MLLHTLKEWKKYIYILFEPNSFFVFFQHWRRLKALVSRLFGTTPGQLKEKGHNTHQSNGHTKTKQNH